MSDVNSIKLNSRNCFTHSFKAVVRILNRTRNDGHGEYLLSIDYHRSAVLHVRQSTEGFKIFKCKDDISLTLLNDGRIEGLVVAYTNICDNTAAALAHAVYFADSHVISVVHCELADDLACEKRSLTADTHDNDIIHSCFLLISQYGALRKDRAAGKDRSLRIGWDQSRLRFRSCG